MSITTERSFNAETITFTAAYPLTIAIEAKDFKETDSGLEYIGERNQQMGDGGIIAQITDLSTGNVVAVTSSEWKVLVIHRAPLNPECEQAANPDTACRFEKSEAPPGWTSAGFAADQWDFRHRVDRSRRAPPRRLQPDSMGQFRPASSGAATWNRQHHPPAPDRGCTFLTIQPSY